MKSSLVAALFAVAIMSGSAFAEGTTHSAETTTTTTETTTHPTDTKAAPHGKMMSRKDARKACLAEKPELKGKELKECTVAKMHAPAAG